MKQQNLIFASMLAFSIFAASCSGDDNESEIMPRSSDISITELFAYAEHPNRFRDTLDVSFNYDLTKVIFTTRALPKGVSEVDLTKVHIRLKGASGATTNISETTLYNLSGNGISIVITAEDGTVRTLSTMIVVTPPYTVIPEYRTTITPIWNKSGSELELALPRSARSMCVAGDYLLVLDNAVDYSANGKIKAYNKLTGAFVKNVPIYEGGWNGPRSYTWTIAADDAGHFALGRLNSGGAGFWLDAYQHIDAVPVNPFKLGGNDLPVNAGKRMQILGNLFSGSAMIYLTTSHFYGAARGPGQYCTFQMNNSTAISLTPSVFNYGNAQWYSGVVQRATVDDQTLYITYNDETSYPNDPFNQWGNLHACHFEVYNPASGEAASVINQQNFKYRILDSKVFKVLDGTFLLTLQQGYSTGTGDMNTIVYNISNPADFSKTPSSANYEKFRIYESAAYVSQNDLRYGNVTVWVDKDKGDAYLYTFFPASDTVEAKITCVKLEVREQ